MGTKWDDTLTFFQRRGILRVSQGFILFLCGMYCALRYAGAGLVDKHLGVLALGMGLIATSVLVCLLGCSMLLRSLFRE